MASKKEVTSEIRIFALGGMCEVGKNCYVIENRDQLFIVDAGILFADDSLPGVDYVIPDFTYLKENQERIVGLFITHGHEDHIGGIPYLVNQVIIPKIYACGIAIELIKSKFLEFPDIQMPEIVEYTSSSIFKFKDTEISFILLNHSIPDEHAILFRTQEGTILHTGDFKVDFTPVGPLAEYDKITKLGAEGLTLLLSDSTNAIHEGFSSSEKKVGESIMDLFNNIKGRILIATFASNLYRISQIVDASVANNRKIAVFGRSMEKTIEIGIKTGYIHCDPKQFIEPTDVGNYPANEITIICTGSQGEPMAALSRVANGSHKFISLIPGDTVIFSSSPIPGNQEGVNKTINLLFKNGANVIVNSPFNDTHTSGHANRGELRLMHSLLRPKYFMPIHGEYRMLKMHSEVAIECGLKPENAFFLRNGEILHLTKDNAYVDGCVQYGSTYIEGTLVGAYDRDIIDERRKLANDGLFGLVFTIDENTKQLVCEPQVISRGFIYMKENEALTKTIVEEGKRYCNELLEKAKTLDYNRLEKAINEYMTVYVDKITDREPMFLTIFMPLLKNEVPVDKPQEEE